MSIEFNILRSNAYFTLACAVFFLSCNPSSYYTFAQFEANFSSNCENGNCTSIICIDDNPCEKSKSNSTNITTLYDFLKNKTTQPTDTPRDIV
ncbi:hypothetical protein BH18THE1_BH18THE1_03480 [soil metagenome]